MGTQEKALWSAGKSNAGFVSSLPAASPENTCLRSQYRCSNGNCVSSIWRCDLDNDCGDMSDERNCRESLAWPRLRAVEAFTAAQKAGQLLGGLGSPGLRFSAFCISWHT